MVKLEFVVFKVNFSGEINYSELYFLCDGDILQKFNSIVDDPIAQLVKRPLSCFQCVQSLLQGSIPALI